MDAHPGDDLPKLFARHERLQDLGLVDVVREDESNHGVLTMTITDIHAESLDKPLIAVLAANAKKLLEAKQALGAETHLMILIDAHGDPAATKAPELPEGVDFVWLLIKFEIEPDHPGVWLAGRNWPTWRT